MNSTLSKYFFYYPATLVKGENIPPLLKEAREFQYLSRDAIRKHQESCVRKLLEHAFTNSEFYRELYTRHGVSPKAFRTLDDLKKFPTVSKQDIVQHSNTISTHQAKSHFVTHKTTGGSTGRAVTITKNSRALAHERAVTWRAYEWAGVTVGDPQARFWGVPLKQLNQLKHKLIDIIANRRRFSAFAISDENFSRFHAELQRFRPAYLYGYASIVDAYANYLAENSLAVPESTKCIITTSEVLTEDLRDSIEGKTGLKVFNEYGCGEVGSIAHECDHGSLHIMDENLVVNIYDGPDQADTGDIIVTDLHNYAFPLINYEVGDHGSFTDQPCPCGRTLSILEKIHGRAYDILETETGEKVHPEYVMYIFEELKAKIETITQFQVIQGEKNSITINLVTDELPDFAIALINERMKSRFGDSLSIKINYVSEIPREPSGKMRLVKRLGTA